MKRWALLVAALYFLILLTLTIPAIAAAFVPAVSWREVPNIFAEWLYWVWLLTLTLSQFALLAVPVRLATRRPVSQGSLLPTVLSAGLMAGGLVLGAGSAIYEFIFADKGPGGWLSFLPLVLGVCTWCCWSVIFYRMSRSQKPADVLTRQCRLLFKSSILELLIAVPTHVVARYRNYCCAGFMTFIGLSFGIAVMLYSFGPAVFFLFVERWRRLHPTSTGEGSGETQPRLTSVEAMPFGSSP